MSKSSNHNLESPVISTDVGDTALDKIFTQEEAQMALQKATREKVEALAKQLTELRIRELAKAAKVSKSSIVPHQHDGMTVGGVEDIPPSKLNPPGKNDPLKTELEGTKEKPMSLCKNCGGKMYKNDMCKGCFDKGMAKGELINNKVATPHPVPAEGGKVIPSPGSSGEVKPNNSLKSLQGRAKKGSMAKAEQSTDMMVETPHLHEYLKAKSNYSKAHAKHEKARKDYQSRKIGDAEYMGHRKAFHAAMDHLDSVQAKHAEAVNAKKAAPKPAQSKQLDLGLDKAEEMIKTAPPGFDEAAMHKLKHKYGVESAFKIAWAAHNKHAENKKAEGDLEKARIDEGLSIPAKTAARKDRNERHPKTRSHFDTSAVGKPKEAAGVHNPHMNFGPKDKESIGQSHLGNNIRNGVKEAVKPYAIKEHARVQADAAKIQPKLPHLKAEPPMAKPPSGVNMATKVPMSKPMTPQVPKMPTMKADFGMGDSGKPNSLPPPVAAPTAPKPQYTMSNLKAGKAALKPGIFGKLNKKKS